MGFRLLSFRLLSFGLLGPNWARENGDYGKKRNALPDLICEPVAGDAFHGSLQALQSATSFCYDCISGVQEGDQDRYGSRWFADSVS
jgi:hypothetical protein